MYIYLILTKFKCLYLFINERTITPRILVKPTLETRIGGQVVYRGQPGKTVGEWGVAQRREEVPSRAGYGTSYSSGQPKLVSQEV